MRMLTVALSALALAAPGLAADPTGKWEAKVPGRQGGEMTMTFDLKADGEKLTGTVGNEMMGDMEIEDGKIDGENVSFKQVMQFGERSMTLRWEGKLVGDELRLTRKREGGMGGPGGGRGEGGPGAGGPRGPRGPRGDGEGPRAGGPGGRGPGGGRGMMGGEIVAKRIQ